MMNEFSKAMRNTAAGYEETGMNVVESARQFSEYVDKHWDYVAPFVRFAGNAALNYATSGLWSVMQASRHQEKPAAQPEMAAA